MIIIVLVVAESFQSGRPEFEHFRKSVALWSRKQTCITSSTWNCGSGHRKVPEVRRTQKTVRARVRYYYTAGRERESTADAVRGASVDRDPARTVHYFSLFRTNRFGPVTRLLAAVERLGGVQTWQTDRAEGTTFAPAEPSRTGPD